MSTATAASLRIDVTAGIAGLATGMNKATAIVKGFRNDFDSAMSSVKSAVFSATGAILGLAGVGGIGALLKAGSEMADNLGKTADLLGDTTENIQALHHSAGLAGISIEEANRATKKWVNTVAEAANGNKKAQDTLKELGLTAADLKNKLPTESLAVLAEALSGVKSQADRVRIASDLFGERGTSMLNMLAEGADFAKAATAEIDALGLSISRVEAKKIENANDSLSKVSAVVVGFGEKLYAQLAPAIGFIADLFLDWVKDLGGVDVMAKKTMDGIVTGIGWVLTAFDYLQIGWETIKLGVITFGDVALNIFKKVADAVLWVADAVGLDVPDSFAALDAVVEGFDTAMIDSQARLVTLISQVGQNAEFAKTKLDEVNAAANDLAVSQVVPPTAGDNPVVKAQEDQLAAEQLIMDMRIQGKIDELNNIQQINAQMVESEYLKGQLVSKIQEEELKNQIQRGEAAFSTMLGNVASHNKTFFKIQKVYRLSKLAMEAPAAIADSYAWGASWGGPPAGATMAGIAAGAMLGYASQLISASYGGGSVGGASGGGGGGNPVTSPIQPGSTSVTTPAPQASGSVTININGPSNEQFILDEVIPMLQESITDRDVVLIRNGSRQAAELQA